MVMLYRFIEENLGDILMAIAGIISFVSIILLILEILRSRELKIILQKRQFLKILNRFIYLQQAPDMLKNESFLYGHKNNGRSPCDVKSITIDKSYIENHSAYLVKEDEENV